MAGNKKTKHTLFIAILLSFICGFVAGAGYVVYKDGSHTDSTVAKGQSATAGSRISGQQGQAIKNLQTRLAADPGDFQLWIQLGNLYFDTGQPAKAITAYQRSLEHHTGNANLLTDLGIMYRRNGEPQKAIEYFDRAMAMDPKHEPSRLNKGIVLFFDLHEPNKAIAVWEALLKIDPDARTANGGTVRDLIKEVRSEQTRKNSSR